MAHDVDLTADQAHPSTTRRTVHLTDLGQAIVETILPRKRKKPKTGTPKNALQEREREQKRQLEIERALWQPGHWRNKLVNFIRPDGRVEGKEVGWCIDNGFKKIKNGDLLGVLCGATQGYRRTHGQQREPSIFPMFVA